MVQYQLIQEVNNAIEDLLKMHVSNLGLLYFLAATATTTIATTTTTSVIQAVTYYAVQSGAFDDTETWATGLVPSSDCLIIIPAGTTVTVSSSSFNFNLRTVVVYGTLTIISSDSLGFTFTYAVNVIITNTGTLESQITANRINFPVTSVFTFSTGATFTGSDTQLRAYSSAVSQTAVVTTITSTSNPQLASTVDFLSNLTARTFSRATFIVRRSGSFSDSVIWAGLYRPSSAFCSSTGGCGLYIDSGFNVSTSSLNGTLTSNFARITIASDAVLQLGTFGSTTGFKFRSPVRLDCYGVLRDFTEQAGGVLVPPSSSVNFFTSGSFLSAVATTFAVYNPSNQAAILESVPWSTSFNGPIFYNISSVGVITTSTTGKHFFVFV